VLSRRGRRRDRHRVTQGRRARIESQAGYELRRPVRGNGDGSCSCPTKDKQRPADHRCESRGALQSALRFPGRAPRFSPAAAAPEHLPAMAGRGPRSSGCRTSAARKRLRLATDLTLAVSPCEWLTAMPPAGPCTSTPFASRHFPAEAGTLLRSPPGQRKAGVPLAAAQPRPRQAFADRCVNRRIETTGITSRHLGRGEHLFGPGRASLSGLTPREPFRARPLAQAPGPTARAHQGQHARTGGRSFVNTSSVPPTRLCSDIPAASSTRPVRDDISRRRAVALASRNAATRVR